MIYGYCRVSTKGQLEGNSIEDQEKTIRAIYPDAQITVESFSGAKEREKFNALTSSLKKDDLLVVTKLDRFCRTTKAGLQHIEEMTKKGAKIHILNMGLIEDTPMGKLIITNLLAFAEFERAMIVERTQSGKAIAKTKAGFTEGRPKKYNDYQIQNAIVLLKDNSYKKVELMTGIGKSTLIRAKSKQCSATEVANEVEKERYKRGVLSQ